MNNYALIDAVGLLDAELLDKHMEQKERLQMKLQKGKKRAFVKWGALAACFALTFAAVILFHDKNSPEIVYQEGDMCRPATISPSTSGCYEEKITRKDIETLFGRSDFDKFGLDPENFVDADRLVGNSGILYHQSGEVHTVKLNYRVGDSLIYVIIDPVAYPTFILDDNKNLVEINGYTAGIVEYEPQKTDKYSYSSDSAHDGLIDIGMKKGSMGILIIAAEGQEEELIKLYNLILDSNLNIELLNK